MCLSPKNVCIYCVSLLTIYGERLRADVKTVIANSTKYSALLGLFTTVCTTDLHGAALIGEGLGIDTVCYIDPFPSPTARVAKSV